MHLEQAVLSLGRHHGVRAGRQLDCMVGEVLTRCCAALARWKVGFRRGRLVGGVPDHAGVHEG